MTTEINGVSSFAQARRTQNVVRSLQARLAETSEEISTGVKHDVAKSLGSQVTVLVGAREALNQSKSFQETADAIGTRMQSMQDALSKIQGLTQDVRDQVLKATGTSDEVAPRFVRVSAESALNQVRQFLNASIAGRHLFSGNEVATAPIVTDGQGEAAVKGVLGDFATALGAPITEDDVDALINGPDGIASIFDETHTDTALHWSTAFYQGAAPATPDVAARIDETTSIRYGVKATDQGFKDVMMGLHMLASIDYNDKTMTTDAWRKFADSANTKLQSGLERLVDVTADLGLKQQAAKTSKEAHGDTITMLNGRIADMEGADPFETAARVSQYEQQLNAAYAVTARVSRLSLVNYM
jgi:flagellar hook-associated protein 3 FlgL